VEDKTSSYTLYGVAPTTPLLQFTPFKFGFLKLCTQLPTWGGSRILQRGDQNQEWIQRGAANYRGCIIHSFWHSPPEAMHACILVNALAMNK